jgi:hypothetical protein
VFSAAAQLTSPVTVMKEKHVRMKLSAAALSSETNDGGSGGRRSLTHKAVGWRLAERFAKENLLPGDQMQTAFTLDHNEHPDFGGIELSLKDFKSAAAVLSPLRG